MAEATWDDGSMLPLDVPNSHVDVDGTKLVKIVPVIHKPPMKPKAKAKGADTI